ncbi:hypothetical protein [Cryptosporangium aurantiacum]|uniref:Uncharacterized protein n=1 Tax=Cryptosporangium aurantiacum TaxID=134849 RepID=A0A1M7RM28_9ACTN|nr:hypothetical protein [Cryptosporangium aurantiacum]SHN47385.1 hypothetical protein SAMN05443668_12331 [Cryptosporangium aurantiacum]
MDESTTRALLTRALDDAPPPAPVDLDLVVRAAQARRRDRNRWLVAAAAGMVLVVTMAITVLAVGGNTDRAAPPAGRGPNDNDLPATAPTQFDPARSSLKVDGLPSSLTERGTATRTTDLVVYASAKGSEYVQAQVGAKGTKLKKGGWDSQGKETDGPLIDGHRSTWRNLGDSGYILRWEWAPGAEAQVALQGVKKPLAVATRVASSLQLDLETPTRLPFTLRPPSGYELREFQTTTDPTDSPAATVAFGGPGLTFISVNANLIGNGIGEPNTIYQDREARVTTQDGYLTVVMAASDLKVTGTCNYRSNSMLTAAEFKALCLATTASAQRVADLETPGEWPVYAP